MTKDEKIKYLINLKFGSVKNFSEKIGMPYTTVDSILKRGILKSNVLNALTICNALSLDIEELKTLSDKEFFSSISHEKLTRKEFMGEILALLERTDIDTSEKALLMQTVEFICLNK